MDFLQYIHNLFSYGKYRDGGILFENCISIILKNSPNFIEKGIKYYNTNDDNDIKELQNNNINICVIGGQSKGIDGIIKIKNNKYIYIQIKFSSKPNNKPDLTEFYKIFTNNKDKRFINKGILICNFKYTSDDNLYVYGDEHITKWFSTHSKLLSTTFVKNINNNIKIKNTKTNDIKIKDIKTNDVKVKDNKTNDVKIKDNKTNDVKIKDNKIKDTKVKDTKVKNTKTNDVKVKNIDNDKIKYIKEDILLFKKFHIKYNRFIRENETDKIGIHDINGNRLKYIKNKLKKLDENNELIIFIKNNYIELYKWYLNNK